MKGPKEIRYLSEIGFPKNALTSMTIKKVIEIDETMVSIFENRNFYGDVKQLGFGRYLST